MAGMGNEKAAFTTESDIITGPQVSPPEANIFSKTEIFWKLHNAVSRIFGMSLGAKCLFAKLSYEAGESESCRVGMPSLASSLGTNKKSIQRWRAELERRGLIRIGHERPCCRYFLAPRYRRGNFVSLAAEVMKRRDVSITYKSVLCWLSVRMAGNGFTWARQKDIAEGLGLSKCTIPKAIRAMKARGEIQKWPCIKNGKQGLKYILTGGAVKSDISSGNHTV